MGILRGVLKRGTILENNIVQTAGSAGAGLLKATESSDCTRRSSSSTPARSGVSDSAMRLRALSRLRENHLFLAQRRWEPWLRRGVC